MIRSNETLNSTTTWTWIYSIGDDDFVLNDVSSADQPTPPLSSVTKPQAINCFGNVTKVVHTKRNTFFWIILPTVPTSNNPDKLSARSGKGVRQFSSACGATVEISTIVHNTTWLLQVPASLIYHALRYWLCNAQHFCQTVMARALQDQHLYGWWLHSRRILLVILSAYKEPECA